MTTLAEFMIIAGADNRPPMLEKSFYDSWKSQDGTTRTKKYEELSVVEKLQADCLVVHVFNQGDDLIACLNKAMAFLIVVASLRFPSTNNKLRTSSNPRNQATIQDGRETVQQVQGRQGQSYAGECHMTRQCTQLKRPRNAAWFKEKAMLAEAQESGQILDEEQLAFLADPDIPDGQAVLMANLSNYGSDVISKNLSNQIKEKESLFQTFIVFKNESKQKESKYMDKEIDLEKKIKKLDNIVYKVGQSAQTKAQRIKTTLYDGSVISSQHAASHVIDDEETLILEELQTSHPNTDQSASSPVKIKAPKELPKLTMQLNQEIFQKDSLSNNQDTLEIPEYFENNNLKAQLQAKDTTICKLKEHVKYMRENEKEEKVKHEMDEIETINIELEHRKEIVKNVTQIPIATTIAPGMIKIDLDPLAPRLLKNREAHIDYLKHTQEQVYILWEIVKQAKAKQLLDNALDFACCPDCSLVSGLQILKTYDKESLSAHELRHSGLVPNPIPQQPCNPPKRYDWDCLFQPMFDEYFNAPTIVVSLVPVVVAPRAVDIADSPVSTSIDQDTPSTSIPSTQEQEHSPIISQGVEESPKTSHFHDDPLYESLHEYSTSQGSSSNVRPSHPLFELLGIWTKDHPIANVIGDPSRSVSTRKQLKLMPCGVTLMPSELL
ncbi:hypothetical protein Tco_0698147 [Tanacetum coccineum]